MARKFREEISEWSRGAITELPPTKIPLNASPRAYNSAWLQGGYPAKRKGLSVITQTGETGKPAILALGRFKTIDWTIADNGRWSKIASGAFAPIDATDATPFTAPTAIPSTAIANSLLFAVNGTDLLKTDGSEIFNFGMAAPGTPTAAVGAAGTPSGTYRIALTGFNENTGHESSLGVFDEVAVSSQKIDASWTFPTDPQVTHVRVHIFKVGLSDHFFRLGSTNVTPTPDTDTGGYASGTTSITIDVSDSNINDLIIKSPTTQENDPPPTGTKFITYYGSRMWATDGQKLFYSKIENPESFDPNNFEPVNTDDDQDIVAIGKVANVAGDEHLTIYKERSLHMLFGPNDPNTWEVKEFAPITGLQAHRTLVEVEGALWWKSEQGFAEFKFGELPKRVDTPSIGNRTEDLNYSAMSGAIGIYDSVRQRTIFAVPESGQTRNTVLFPYNERLKLWEDRWDPMDISAMGTFFDASTGEPFVAVGNYAGRVFRLWDTPYMDGVRLVDGATVFTVKGTVESSTATTLTDSAATFDTDGDGLDEIILIVVDPNGATQRKRITSNTGTVLTIDSAWASNPDSTWTYYIGCPNWEFETKHMAPTSVPGAEGSIFQGRNFKRAFISGFSDTGSAVFDVHAIIDNVVTPFAATMNVTLEGVGAFFDIDFFDLSTFGSGKVVSVHRTLGKHGKVCGLRAVNREPDQAIILFGLGLMGSELSYKL